jgi:FkbM family methyltransferase
MINKTKQQFKNGDIDKQTFINTMFEHNQQLFEYLKLLKDTDIKSIEIGEGGVLFTTREKDIKFFCTKNDKRSAPFEIMNFDTYEADDAAMMYELINDGDNVFDVGANIGFYSINFAKSFPNAKINSFEPIPSTFTLLEKNVLLNGTTNIEINNFGFSSEEKILEFYVSASTSVSSSAQDLTSGADTEKVVCKVLPLDVFVEKNNAKVDFIKCDVEGAELFVYQGAKATLAIQKPIVFTEMLRKWAVKFDYHPNDIIALFDELGYSCFVIYDKVNLRKIEKVDESTSETNFVFLNNEKHLALIEKYAK